MCVIMCWGYIWIAYLGVELINYILNQQNMALLTSLVEVFHSYIKLLSFGITWQLLLGTILLVGSLLFVAGPIIISVCCNWKGSLLSLAFGIILGILVFYFEVQIRWLLLIGVGILLVLMIFFGGSNGDSWYGFIGNKFFHIFKL